MVSEWVGEAARRGGTDDAEFFRERVFAGDWQLWLAWDGEAKGVVLTSLADMVRGRVAVIKVCAGRDFRAWAHLVETMEEWARANGCIGLETSGRPGFGRFLPGYGRRRVTFYKEFDHAG